MPLADIFPELAAALNRAIDSAYSSPAGRRPGCQRAEGGINAWWRPARRLNAVINAYQLQ